MASVVYATPGKLYLTPTSVTGTNGTLIPGIEERAITLDVTADIRERRNGVGVNSGPRIYHGRYQRARLLVPLRNQSVNGLKILLAHLTTDGAIMRPTGGTAAAQFQPLPTFALILRPDSTSEKYVYSPNWALGPQSVMLVNHSDNISQLADAVLELIATKPTNATGPAWEWAAAATIATAFGLSENP
jgi:hypothetical protein